MSTTTNYCTYNRYKWTSSSAWGTPDSGTNLYAGKDGGGTFYATLLRVPFDASLATARVNTATLTITRYVSASSAAHTLLVAVVSADISGGTYSILAGPISWSVTSGAGAKTCDVAALMPTLLADSTNRYLMIYSSSSGQYTEFRSIEYGTATDAHIDLDYSQGLLNYATGGAWHQCEVYYASGGGWQKVEPYYASGGAWHLLG